MIPIWGTLSGTYVWRWRSVDWTSCLLVQVFVAVVLDTVCSPGTFTYVYEDHCRIGVLYVVIVTVVLDSACNTDKVLCFYGITI